MTHPDRTESDEARPRPQRNWKSIVGWGCIAAACLLIIVLWIGVQGSLPLRTAVGWAGAGLALISSVALSVSWFKHVLLRNTIVILASLSAGLLGAVLWIAFEPHLTPPFGPMTDENHNSVFQFLMVVALGGAISFAHQQFAQTRDRKEKEKLRERDRQEAEKVIVLRIADDLLDAYNRTRRVRQILRARVLRAAAQRVSLEENKVPVDAYDEQMAALVDAHLAFESIERRIRASSNLFQDRYAELQKALNAIGDYLLDALEEFEDQRAEFGEEGDRALTDLPELMRFLGTRDDGPRYEAQFERPFNTAVRLLRTEVQRRSFMDPRDAAPTPTRAERVPTSVLGSPEGVVRLIRYQRRWQQLFEAESQRLNNNLNEIIENLHHIGSTAVPGLAAEPILDLLMEVPSIDEKDAFHKILLELEYEDVPESESHERLVYCRSDGDRLTHLLSVVGVGSTFGEKRLRLRELLRADPRAKREFETAKWALRGTSAGNAGEYRKGIEQLVEETLRRTDASQQPS